MMRHANLTMAVWIVLPLFAIALIPSAAIDTASASTQTGVIVPLYAYPGADWTALIQAKQADPGVPIVAIIDPVNTGPGFFQDPNFVSGIHALQSVGIVVLGYVWTNYAQRSLSSAEADIVTYQNWYGVNGIYFDQMGASQPGQEWYYSTLNSYVKSLGMTMTVGNAGSDIPSSYVGTLDTIIIYENSGLPTISQFAGWHTSYATSNFAMIAYGVGWLDTSFVQAASSYVGYIYLTDGVPPNPYAPVSSYIGSLVASLASVDSASSAPSPPAANGNAGSITVNTVDAYGNPLGGVYTTLWQNGVQVQSCFSPCTFAVYGGQAYQVAVADYQSLIFYQWADGTPLNFYTVNEPSVATALTLTAEF